MTKRTFILLSGLIVLIYLLILNRYGTAIPALMPPEEINFAGLARNIAEGKGAILAIPSEIIPDPAATPRRLYVPVISYAFALGGWGRIWGFDPLSLRWFNRLIGALDLLLLIGLARRWGLSRWLALLVAFWTAMDVLFQLTSNILRADVFSLFWVLLGLLAFTHGQENGKARWIWISGVCFAVALFAHFLEAVFLFTGLLGILLLERRWKWAVFFGLPGALAGLGWLLYALQDWPWFLTIANLAAQDRVRTGWEVLIVSLLGVQATQPIFGIYPINSPLWLPILVTISWAKFRRRLELPFWKIGVLWLAYLTGYIRFFPFYAAWFTPFGYLALTFLAQLFLKEKQKLRKGLVILALAWSGYQLIAVGQCWQAAPPIRQAHQAFFQELASELPRNGSLWMLSVPDPSFFLYETRPDLTIYIGSGYFEYPDFFPQLDGVICVPKWAPPESIPQRLRREWVLPGVIADYSVLWIEPIR